MSADLPVWARPAVRVYLDLPDRSVIQLTPYRGLDMLETVGDDPDRLVHIMVFHAFGPALEPAPLQCALRVENADDIPEHLTECGLESRIGLHEHGVRIHVRVLFDPFNIARFAPTSALVPHTNN